MTTGPSGSAGPSTGTPRQWILVAIPVLVVSGFIASLLDEGDTQALLFAISSIASVVAAFLLAVVHLRAGRVLSGAGFAALGVLAIAGHVAGYTGAVPESIFGNIGLLFLPALLLVAAEAWSFIWARAAAALAGIGFAIWSFKVVLGGEPADIESPIVIAAFILFTVANIGWVMTIMAEGDGPGTP